VNILRSLEKVTRGVRERSTSQQNDTWCFFTLAKIRDYEGKMKASLVGFLYFLTKAEDDINFSFGTQSRKWGE